ncbi:hypothetical protein KTT_30790 [Tengunoibacter tsumagoiensis]|uniref:Pyrrolo-quinoline quinone n=1 Tax=Tengunoibacter tsumagoiensis TaxID=2014871 RepID=A0A402A254_9CHLR|nr:hypothetical protein KTT_30790 [Tengunoibacter tsumagoiensis]
MFLPLVTTASKLVAARGHTEVHSSGVAVTTYHNDNLRTGQNLRETLLTTSNVNVHSFGRKVVYPVDGKVAAQPLYLPNVPIGGNTHNVVYVATENDSVYAFDSDATQAGAPLWQTSFIHPPTVTPVYASDIFGHGSATVSGDPIGITGTPVIDTTTGTLFVVSMTKEGGAFIQRLHALDIQTGNDKPGSPLQITASVAGHSADSKNGMVYFDAQKEQQRAALLLLNHNVYIAWASFGDRKDYHGWVLGYSYDGKHLSQIHAGIYNDMPNGEDGGIWMGASGPSADAEGNIYAISGNGTFNLNQGGSDAGDTILKLSTKSGLQLVDYFTPFNQKCLDTFDKDLGSSGALLLPDQTGTKHPHELLGIGKEGRLYLLDRDTMGKYVSDQQLKCIRSGAPANAEQFRTDVDHAVEEFPIGITGAMFGSMGYWQGTTKSGPLVYIGGFKHPLEAFQLKNGLLPSTVSSQSTETFAFSGATPSVSSNGNLAGTGIVWVTGSVNCPDPGCTPLGPAILRAYDATDLKHELFSSDQNPKRDQLDSYMKFSVPTVADGHVFVATQTGLSIYGLL